MEKNPNVDVLQRIKTAKTAAEVPSLTELLALSPEDQATVDRDRAAKLAKHKEGIAEHDAAMDRITKKRTQG